MTNMIHVLIPFLILAEGNPLPNTITPAGEYGILQITEACVQDVNRVYGTKYIIEDALDPTMAKGICVLYLMHYGRSERIPDVTYEQLARMWNGGPNGHKKPSTEFYWTKVLEAGFRTPQ
jgi:hypothetical protein